LSFKKDTTEMKKVRKNLPLEYFSDNLIWFSIFINQLQIPLNNTSSSMCFSSQCCMISSNNPLRYMINMRLNFDLFQNRLLSEQSPHPVVPPDPAKKNSAQRSAYAPLIWSQLKLPTTETTVKVTSTPSVIPDPRAVWATRPVCLCSSPTLTMQDWFERRRLEISCRVWTAKSRNPAGVKSTSYSLHQNQCCAKTTHWEGTYLFCNIWKTLVACLIPCSVKLTLWTVPRFPVATLPPCVTGNETA
jgi:hypothetical protein